jgi:hypothetical protein
MDMGHSVKALLIYSDFPGCPFNCELCDVAVLSMRNVKGEIPCR